MAKAWDIKIYDDFAKTRDKLASPLVKLFDILRLAPDVISYTGVMFMVLFVFMVGPYPVVAFWLLFGRMMMDVLDGALARYQKVASDRGKFIDVLADHLGFALYIIGIIYAGLVEALPAVGFLYFAVILTILMIVKKSLAKKSDWLFYAQAGALPYSLIYASYILFAIYAFGGHNYLDVGNKIFAVVLLLKSLQDYWTVRKTKFKT